MSYLERRTIAADIDSLIQAIAEDNAVVFVGSGASAASGFPMWTQFLERTLGRVESANNGKPWDIARKRIRQGDYLTAAELLRIRVGNQLNTHIREAFATPKRPSPVHQAVARIPFSLALTTNYDRLLESAYRSRPSTITWRDPDALFAAIKHKRFMVVKTHGDVDNPPSQILTNLQYRDLIYRGHSFQSCLKYLLLFRTVVFVGYSFRDRDLLRLLDEARIDFGENFGPHYAVMFADEVDKWLESFLLESYGIRLITLGEDQLRRQHKPPHDAPRKATFIDPGDPAQDQFTDVASRSSHDTGSKYPAEPYELTPDDRTALVVGAFRDLSGRSAIERARRDVRASLDDPLFCRRAAARDLLLQALTATGSYRGDVCYIHHHHEHKVVRVASVPDLSLESFSKDDLILPNSVIGTMFLTHYPSRPDEAVDEGTSAHGSHDDGRDAIYLADTLDAGRELEAMGLSSSEYVICDTDVRSELACPISSDGVRVGVLNLESDAPHAYSVDHLEAARHIADQFGWIHFEAKQRQSECEKIEHYLEDASRLKEVLNYDPNIQDLRIELALYRLDYNEGTMTARCTASDKPLTYHFEDVSFASTLLQARSSRFIPDVSKELSRRRRGEFRDGSTEEIAVNQAGVDLFGIQGPLFGTPVRVRGTTVSILVVWSRLGTSVNLQEFRMLMERCRRIGFLVATYARAETKEKAERAIRNIWRKPKKRGKRSGIPSLAPVSQLLSKEVGFQRVRLWETVADANGRIDKFRLVHLDTITQADRSPTTLPNLTAPPSDAYCQYTILRYLRDPYARKQNRDMLDEVDSNSLSLEKDPRLSWFVAPIVRGNTLLGFLSADYQIPTGKSRPLDDGLGAHLDGAIKYPVCREHPKSSTERDAAGMGFLDLASHIVAEDWEALIEHLRPDG